MTILLTNDDEIYAQGIYALYLQLKRIASVVVVAPDSEQSSVGHGITLSHPIWYKKVSRKGKFFGFGISGTPADCVKFAVSVILKKKPGMVISGINAGPNDGCSVFYSGTVAGAREGALLGIPSMAVSLATFLNPDFSYAAQCAAKLAKTFLQRGIPKGTFLNVNVPAVKSSRIKGFKITCQCTDPIHSSFRKHKDPHLRDYYWMTGRAPTKKKDMTIDTYAVNNNYVTVTPVCSDSTDYAFLGKLTEEFLNLKK